MKEPPKIIVQLIHIQGPLKGKIQEFTGPEITMGRHPSCDLQFPQDLVVISRRHATIVREGNRFRILDQSTNGTFVNGEKAAGAYLKNGDVIFFTQDGPKVSFLTRIHETSESPDIEIPLTPVAPCAAREKPAQQVSPASLPSSRPAVPPPVYRDETVKAPLVIQYGPILQSFNELPITIGADHDCDLRLDHPSLAGRHIQIFFSHGSYGVKDLTGRNQVLINSRPILSSSPLASGDQLFFTPEGPAFHFLEGGRMAEIPMPKQESRGGNETASSQKNEAPAKEKSRSLFKKFFR